ncbi:hypothetical protein QJS10_CPA01g02298 [Acorus calamus]|uniref:Uncharacterized protein n=1 Tax=Acorus calamus TaxID=4465 RepID=A0AAV9FEL8_ACOCL|nr:hypothetical protein QJS10_CPA01g02298 [Acorus calamus]
MSNQARLLLQSLVIIGAISGLSLGVIGTSVPWFLPKLFTTDRNVISEMHKVLLPYFVALMVTPSTHSLEGTLLARFSLALHRLTSPAGMLYSDQINQHGHVKVKAA